MSIAVWIRRLRLFSGLVLTLFVVGHLANLAFGIISIEAIVDAASYLLVPWQTAVGLWVLLACALVHMALGLQAIAARRSLALSTTDAVQIVLAVAVPPLLMPHTLLATVAGKLATDFHPTYETFLAIYWRFAPLFAIRQLLALMVVWTHAAIGLYSWLVITRAWHRIGGVVLLVLFGVPVLALVGFVKAGSEILAAMNADPGYAGDMEGEWQTFVAVSPQLQRYETILLSVAAAAALAAIAALVARALVNRRRLVQVTYDEGFLAVGRLGLTMLELSRLSGVPHAHICSGRGRCGTCRVAVRSGTDQLSRMRDGERHTLAAFAAPPDVRLACQARVLGPGVEAMRLLPAFADASAARDPEAWAAEPAAPAEAGA